MWSEQQEAIFNWFTNGQGNLVVRARAGCGKTTTILEAVSRANCKNALLCAFGRDIAKELNLRLVQPKTGRAEAKTLHAAGLSIIRANWPNTKVDKQRGFRLAQKVCPKGTTREAIQAVEKVAGLVKNILLPGASLVAIADIATQYGVNCDNVPTISIAEWVQKAIDASLQQDGLIDYDDMLYMPIANKFVRPTYDLVVVDEAQDMNPIQINLAKAMCTKNGRIVVVGDDKQAIYGFRGADSQTIDKQLIELGAKEMPLTVTYRCGRAIVEEAAKYVPDFTASSTVGPGEIHKCDEQFIVRSARAGDFVLSRTNAPLGSICLGILRQGRRASIKGKDIGEKLVQIIRRVSDKVVGVDELLPRLKQWQLDEVERINLSVSDSKTRSDLIMNINDEYQTIAQLSNGLSTVYEVIKRLDSLFSDNAKGTIICSTVHKAKGLEADNVYILSKTFKREGSEEDNIKYVAITRAKKRLIWAT